MLGGRPEVFLGRCVLKIWITFTREQPCWNVISIKLLCSFIGITFQHLCSPVNLMHIFRTPFLKNTSGGVPLSRIRVKKVIACISFLYWKSDMKEITINIVVIVWLHASVFRGILIGFLLNHSVRVPSHRSCWRNCSHCSCIRALFDKQRFTNSHSIFLISLFILCFANTFTFLKDFNKTRFSFSLIAINNVLLFSFVLHLSLVA